MYKIYSRRGPCAPYFCTPDVKCLFHLISYSPIKKLHRFIEFTNINYIFSRNFITCKLFVFGATAPQWARTSSITRFLDHTQRRTTVGRTRLDEWSARRRELHLTTHNTHNRQTSMPQAGFEPMVSAGEWLQTYALARMGSGTSITCKVK